MTTIKNEKVSVTFHEKTEYNKPYIIASDLTDRFNDPTVFTRKVRGINRAWEFIGQIFQDERLMNELTINDISKILDEKFNLDTHYYCAVD